MPKFLLTGMLFFLINYSSQAQVGASNIGNGAIKPDSVGYASIGKAGTQKCARPGPCGSACFVYTFIGAGEWDIEGNWEGNQKPPAVLSGCFEIIINPANNAECILNIPMQMIPPGAVIRIMEGKIFRVPGNLVIKAPE